MKAAKAIRQNEENEGLAQNVLVKKLVSKLTCTENEIDLIYKKTVGQSERPEWIEQRKGWLTASKFKAVYTRSISLQKNPKVDPSNLLSTVISYKSIRPTWQMKHGISTEVHAKTKYLSVLRREKHINLTHYDPGMTIMKKHPFISVPTDLDVSCLCCGKGHAEFKCPGSIKDQVPSADNLPYLEIDENGQTKLNRNSDYYFQVQGQMGVTGGKFTDFFIFTFKGYYRERILFNEKFWNVLLPKLVWFWWRYVGPELITMNLKLKLEEQDSIQDVSYVEEDCVLSQCISCSTDQSIVLASKQVTDTIKADGYNKITRQRKAKSSSKKLKTNKAINCNPVYLCGLCSKEVLDDPINFEEESVQCDSCPLWYHFVCTGFIEETKPGENDNWFCSQCLAS